jgi:mannose-6-phosphate isomerase-like protein (cupin superfamily)
MPNNEICPYIPKIIIKPWGYEKIVAHTDIYVGKILHINPTQRLSKQYHKIKDETIYVLSGTLHVYIGEDEDLHTLIEGQSLRVMPNIIHRFEAPNNYEPTVLFEVSTPELNDIVRLKDDYERA